MTIYIDGDACPVKDEVYRVAKRHAIAVVVVANARLRVPEDPAISMIVVPGKFDAADDWIVERAGAGDIVISSDIPLADRCIRNGARVLGPKGHEFDESSMGDALATRALLDQLRQGGVISGGPAPFAKADRSRFLGALENLIVAVRRGRPSR